MPEGTSLIVLQGVLSQSQVQTLTWELNPLPNDTNNGYSTENKWRWQQSGSRSRLKEWLWIIRLIQNLPAMVCGALNYWRNSLQETKCYIFTHKLFHVVNSINDSLASVKGDCEIVWGSYQNDFLQAPRCCWLHYIPCWEHIDCQQRCQVAWPLHTGSLTCVPAPTASQPNAVPDQLWKLCTRTWTGPSAPPYLYQTCWQSKLIPSAAHGPALSILMSV